MDKRTDINNASFAYGINLLRMLLDMNLITQDEYEKNYPNQCGILRHRGSLCLKS